MSFIPDEIIASVLKASDIVEVIEGYLPLKQTGRYSRALCPFHTEKTPSFTVNPERQIFYCFGCGEGGDVFRFLMRREGFTFPEAVRYLAHRAGIVIPEKGRSRHDEGRLRLYEIQRLACGFFRQVLQGEQGAEARSYLSRRGVGEEVVERFQLGYAPVEGEGLLRYLTQRGVPGAQIEAAGLALPRQGGRGQYDRFRGRVMIPICDPTGKIVGFGGRALKDQEPKYLNSPETPIYRKGSHLYGLHLAARAIRETNVAVVVEGYFDVITLQSVGVTHTIASLGTAFTPEQVTLLRRYAERVILVFDPDRAGVQAAWRGLELLVGEGVGATVVTLPEGKDPDSFVRESGKEAFLSRMATAQDLVDFLLTRAEERTGLHGIEEKAEAARQVLGLLAKMQEGVRRAKYVQKLAERLGVSETVVLADLKRLGGAQKPPPHASPKESGVLRTGVGGPASVFQRPESLPPVEKTLMQICLLFPEVRPLVWDVLEEGRLSAPPLRSIYRLLREHTGGEEGLARALAHHPDPEVRQVAAELLVHAGEEFADPERMVQDCLIRLRLQEIRAELKVAREQGDLMKAKTLKEQERMLQGGRISGMDYISN
jgi:DNA primase